MDSLVRSLAIAVGADPGDEEELLGATYDARRHLRGLTRVIQDEDLVIEIAKRLYEHERARLWPNGENTWEEVTSPERNSYIFKALNVLDALRDIIAEELNPEKGSS